MRNAVSGERVADAAVRRLTSAIEGIEPDLAAVAPGRLASFSVALDADPVSVPSIGGDSRWTAPGGGLSLHTAGAAARFKHQAATRFAAECERWCVLGTAKALPLAFFTAPPATAVSAPAAWVPRVLVRRSRNGIVATLTARRDETPVRDVIRSWQRELGLMFAPAAAGPCGRTLEVTAAPSATEWRRRVEAAVRAIDADRLAKVVLSRRLDVRLSHAVDAAALAERLAHLHPGCHVFSLPYGRGHVVAASPELLAAKRGARLVSHALAGTVERRGAPDADAEAAAALLASAKERHEHAVVVDCIAARMAEICTDVAHPQEPVVMPLRFVQHLSTPVTGRLREGVGLLDAVSHLHPTPAVLGTPRRAARAWLHEIGERRDGLYSGVSGWIDLAGDGDAVVVLRAAYVEDRSAVLWAGAGIMAASDPEAELAETELKLATMLEVLDAS